ncbi:hypothetical protein FQN60_013121, partial [Etheostoma spectabile]
VQFDVLFPDSGLDAELYYVRDDVVNHYALSFTLPVPSETNSLHFSWHSKTKVDYRLGFLMDNPVAMNQPRSNISSQGEVPLFRVDLFCSGKVDGEAVLTVQLNLTGHANNYTVLNFKRRKMCYKKIDSEPKTPIPHNNTTLPRPECPRNQGPSDAFRGDEKSSQKLNPGHSLHHSLPPLTLNDPPTTSTQVFYISVSVCCIVIFLVAIILAILHLHSMKRVEMEDSDSGSSQGLSQPSTQTTQYLRADTPNNAAPVTNNHPGSAPILQLAASSFQNPGVPPHETKSYPSLRIEKNDLRSVTLMEAKAKVKDIAISRERVTLRDVLHEGTFGRIFHGVLLDEKDPSKEKPVFVKTVKDFGNVLDEPPANINLLPISHVCTEDGEKPMVLLPFMAWGNLKLFLRQCKLAEANNPQAISQQDLVYMAIQIACGMSYLARREVIHKDLATRNCVIDDNMQVKITDNALARDLFPMDYHCLGDNENRPVRWMALESLLNNDFSSASDVDCRAGAAEIVGKLNRSFETQLRHQPDMPRPLCIPLMVTLLHSNHPPSPTLTWAFGVTLWELMTLGQTPYVDIDPFEMSAYLKDGYRIAQPINCPDE